MRIVRIMCLVKDINIIQIIVISKRSLKWNNKVTHKFRCIKTKMWL
jgi:hypothetical protein